ncbi:MAG: fatty acid desaturase [Flavobacterium sp.]|nr:fatty acid desaturase [Flavobacterium sp.]
MNTTAPTFAKQDNLKFFRTLNAKVNNYFKENNIQKTGNWQLYLKTIILFTIFLTPYFLIITLTDMPFWLFLLMSIVLGIGMAGIGMNVMHDGNHTFNWALTTDFKQMRAYLKRKLSYGEAKSSKFLWTTLVITKLIYFSVWIVLPIVIGIAWWKVLIGFFVMHYTAGLILSVVFQLAHVVEETENPKPNDSGEMENTWAVHQLFTTVNFAPKNWIVNWYTGGLNHQIEHHLFPNISHIHYGKIAKLVKETAQDCNLPYYEYKTMRSAVIAHFKHLKELGAQPEFTT